MIVGVSTRVIASDRIGASRYWVTGAEITLAFVGLARMFLLAVGSAALILRHVSTAFPVVYHCAALLKLRSRRLFPTTNTLEKAMAAPASMGFRSPRAASGIARTL